MAHNEFRKDYLLNRWVVIATERRRRPNDFANLNREKQKNAVCPLCVGNEHITPPAILLHQEIENKIIRSKDPATGERPKNWLVRTIPNLYPTFTPPTSTHGSPQIFSSECFGYAIGHHEVVVESPNHDEELGEAELSQLELIIDAYITRYRELTAKPYVKYVSIFRNFGIEAGASLSHAHSQIIATPIAPSIIQEELDTSKAYYIKNGKCAFCDIINEEQKGPRLILENSDFIVFSPYASINPMEFWIAPTCSQFPNIKKDRTSVVCNNTKS
jgi:UDPglucose--hexose-1-phosphate uridylyltransferase